MFVPIDRNHISFHTPGHSGEAYKGCDFFKTDITELSFSDNLLSPCGELKNLNAAWAEAYGLPYAFLVTNGATSALRAALRVLSGTVLVVGDAHISIYNVLKERGGVHYTAATIGDAEQFSDKKIDVVVATYPDYFGNVPNLAAIKQLAVLHGARLLVDSAHGSHFAFCDEMPLPASKYADIVVYSLHKTLPVLTGGALVAGKPEFRDALSVAIGLTHSTSPSYPVLYSAYLCLEQLKFLPHRYEDVLQTLRYFAEDLSDSGFRVEKTADPTRLVVSSPYDGQAVADCLEQCDIYVETVYKNKVVLIVTPYNFKYLSLVAVCLKQTRDLPLYIEVPAPALARVREVDYSGGAFELVNADAAIGRRLYKEIGEYPPASPVWFFGDTVTTVTVDYVKGLKGRAFGLVNGRFCVLK